MRTLFRTLLCVVILAAAFPATSPPASASSCTELIAKRNEVFDHGKKIRQAIEKEKKEVAIAQQGVDLLSGEAQAASRKALAEHEDLLKGYEQNLEGNQKILKYYDDKVAQCRNGSGGGTEITAASWMGTWEEGAWVYVVVANGTGHIKYSFSNTGKGNTSKGNGGCKTAGNVADCSWLMLTGGLRVYGDDKLTLNGNTITQVKTLVHVECIVSSPECLAVASAYDSAKGKSEKQIWHRK